MDLLLSKMNDNARIAPNGRTICRFRRGGQQRLQSKVERYDRIYFSSLRNSIYTIANFGMMKGDPCIRPFATIARIGLALSCNGHSYTGRL